MEIILATFNKNKAKEARDLFSADAAGATDASGITVLTSADIGYTDEPIEDGETYADNAIIKAKAISDWLLAGNNRHVKPCYIWADDSGFEVDFLDKQPGVHSKYFMGVEVPYTERCEKIVEMLSGVPQEKRTARFVSVIACVLPDGTVKLTRGEVEGYIPERPYGCKGFGYDPILFVPSKNKTMAQLDLAEKNEISHRAIALKRMYKLIKEMG
jgi:XTP/dITP diphosphohydrolase